MKIFDEIIKILKEKFDFFNELIDLIENGASGYDINYKLENFADNIKEKEKKFEDLIWQKHGTSMDELYEEGKDEMVDEILDEISKLSKYLLVAYPRHHRFLSVGNDKISNLKDEKITTFEESGKFFNYSGIMESIKRSKAAAIKNIGYIEFLKQKPKPSERRTAISYEKDLNDFIVFLDKKFEEWEQEKERNKIN